MKRWILSSGKWLLENQLGNSLINQACHSSSSPPSPFPALMRIGYLFTPAVDKGQGHDCALLLLVAEHAANVLMR